MPATTGSLRYCACDCGCRIPLTTTDIGRSNDTTSVCLLCQSGAHLGNRDGQTPKHGVIKNP